MIKLVSNQISPNLNISDFFTGLFHLFSKKEFNFEQLFYTKNYKLYNAARTGLTQLIHTLELPNDKKIGIPAFTCAVTATPFLQAGYKIEWIDVDKNGLIDFEDFKKKSETISFVLAIHTFGQEVNIKKFTDLCTEKNIFLLEDCAHYLPQAQINTDARLYSFGREKILSCISGGAIALNKNSKFYAKTQKILENTLPKQNLEETLKLLIHPLIYSLALPWWHAGGKIIPMFFKKTGIIPLAVTKNEKLGKEDFPQKKLAAALQAILAKQESQYKETLDIRHQNAEQWKTSLTKMLPSINIIIPENAFRLICTGLEMPTKSTLLSQKNFHLNEWDGIPIAPLGTNLNKFEYQTGQCPNAESLAQKYITFPTGRRVKDKDIFYFQKIVGKNLIFMENTKDE